jgi:ATP-dependent DNA helicase RecG
MFLDTPISQLPRTAPITIKRLDSLGVKTYLDLLNVFPNRYSDFHKKLSLHDLFNLRKAPLFENSEKNRFTISGTVASFKNQYTRRGFRIQKAVLTDSTASTEIVWFNQQYLATIIKEGMALQVSGFIKETGEFQPEEYEIIPSSEEKSIHTGRIVPVYPERRGMSSRTLRDKIFYILSHPDFTIAEMLPEKILKDHNLISAKEAYRQIHFPENFDEEKSARRRLSFDELFVVQLTSLLVRQKWQQQKIRKPLKVDEFADKMSTYIGSLPFELTPPQKKVISEISADLKKTTPMNRLLQGDVGSGKTVVASTASLLMTLNKERTLFMAPTEILARQHFQTLQKLIKEINAPHSFYLVKN